MSRHASNRVMSAAVIGRRRDEDDRQVLLEIGLEKPVDWEAVEEDGHVICGDLRFVLELGSGEAACRIAFALERSVRYSGVCNDAHTYLLGLSPARDAKGRDTEGIAFDMAVREARLRGRSWSEDVREVRLGWTKDAVDRYAAVPNATYVPDAPIELPAASEDEVARMCDAFDAFCDGLAAEDHDDDCIPLTDEDLELIAA